MPGEPLTAVEPSLTCPYCGSEAFLGNSEAIYGRDHGLVWLCSQWPRCDSYVGTHKGTSRPLGRMANAELRQWRNRAHGAFDPIWQARERQKLPKSRQHAYEWLAARLGIRREECHIAMFDVETCQRVVDLCERRRRRSRQQS